MRIKNNILPIRQDGSGGAVEYTDCNSAEE